MDSAALLTQLAAHQQHSRLNANIISNTLTNTINNLPTTLKTICPPSSPARSCLSDTDNENDIQSLNNSNLLIGSNSCGIINTNEQLQENIILYAAIKDRNALLQTKSQSLKKRAVEVEKSIIEYMHKKEMKKIEIQNPNILLVLKYSDIHPKVDETFFTTCMKKANIPDYLHKPFFEQMKLMKKEVLDKKPRITTSTDILKQIQKARRKKYIRKPRLKKSITIK